jgi:hypothetical protein
MTFWLPWTTSVSLWRIHKSIALYNCHETLIEVTMCYNSCVLCFVRCHETCLSKCSPLSNRNSIVECVTSGIFLPSNGFFWIRSLMLWANPSQYVLKTFLLLWFIQPCGIISNSRPAASFYMSDEAVSSSVWEWTMKWKGRLRKRLGPSLRNYTGIYLEGLRKTTSNLSHDCRCSGRNLKRAPSD